MKRRDPIIEELDRVRENIGKAHDFDVRRIGEAIRQHEDENPEGVVPESPKRTTRHAVIWFQLAGIGDANSLAPLRRWRSPPVFRLAARPRALAAPNPGLSSVGRDRH